MAEITMSQSSGVRPMMLVGWHLWLLWVLASTVGWGVSGPVGVAVGSSGDIIVQGYLGVALGGVLAGVLQWLVLQRRVAQAGWWVLASIVASAAVGIVVFGGGLLNADVGWVVGADAGAIVAWAVLGAGYGAITGPVLVWLVARPVPPATDSSVDHSSVGRPIRGA